MEIPFLELKEQHRRLGAELRGAINRVLDSGWFALGPEVEKFEQAFASYIGAEHCVGVNSGTAALHLALLALGIGPGDEVITVPYTFIATVEAISAVGARPVLVDIDPLSFTMDPRKAEAAVTAKTRAILPVHLCGQTANMEPLLALAKQRGLAVVEDACQAHGAEYQGRKAGAIGAAGCFSFYPSKNLGSCGEAGAVVTNDAGVAEQVRKLRNHGSLGRFSHAFPGFNCRMESIQAAVLSAKLPHLDEWNLARRSHAARYNQLLAGSGVTTPAEMPHARHIYHLYMIQAEDRDGLRDALAKRGIETGVHYPDPVHLEKAYRDLGHRAGDFPVTEHLARHCISLPIYPELSAEAVEYVASNIREILVPARAGDVRTGAKR
jgi:dTDP-4-amino-4,6-dideoxygalactose transaminase